MEPQDLVDWRSRLATALRAFTNAVETGGPVSKLKQLDQVIRALEQEGQVRGFQPTEEEDCGQSGTGDAVEAPSQDHAH